MRCLLRLVVIVLALIGVAALLNPSPEAHRDKIKQAVAQRSQLAGLLGLGDLQAFLSNYHSLGFASYTKAGDQLLTVGAFGMVLFIEPGPGPAKDTARRP